MYIAVILEPGRVWTDHGVIDTVNQTKICTCSDSRDADMIAKVLNQHKQEREAKALLAEKATTP